MYYGFLKNLLAPMGLYELESGPGAQELRAQGAALDELYYDLLELEREAVLITAESFGLEAYEDIVPAKPASGKLPDRQAAIQALLRIDGCGFTREALCDTLYGCGINAVVSESGSAQRVLVEFPGTRGVPANFEKIRAGIERILPCHLEVEYVFSYFIWRELEEKLSSWRELESAAVSWRELEAFV